MATLAQNLRSTTTCFLDSYIKANETKSMRLLSAQLTEECKRYLGPSGYLHEMGAPADLTMSNAEYEAEFGNMSLYTFDRHEVYDIVVDKENLKTAARTELFGTFLADGRQFSRTFVWFLDMNADGSRIVKVYQHNDVEEGKNFRKMIQEYKKNKSEA